MAEEQTGAEGRTPETPPERPVQTEEEPSLIQPIRKSAPWRENLRLRALTGVPALLVVLALAAYVPLVLLAVLVAAAGAYGYLEYLRMVGAGQGMALPVIPLVAAGVLVGLGGLLGTPQALGGALFLAVVVALYALWFHRPANGPKDAGPAAAALLGLVLVPWLFNHLSLLLRLEHGRVLAMFLVLALALNDTLAYLVGSLLGRTPLLPAVSPKKTVEGAVGGMVGGVLAGLLAWLWLRGQAQPYSAVVLAVVGAVLALMGQCGDLLESKLKRLNGAEASGRFLPGHGGLLDRLDAFLLATPFLYYLLVFLR